MTHALIYAELKDPGSTECGFEIARVERVSVTEQITSMHKNQTR